MTSIHPTAADVKTIQFSDGTFAVIDPAQGAVSIHRGQRTGADSDWGGQCIAWLELDKALVILEAVQAVAQPAPANWFTRPDSEYAQMDAEMRPLNIERW